MKTTSRFFSRTRRLALGSIGACALIGAAPGYAFDCHSDMYAALLTRLVQNTTDNTVNPDNPDFLDATRYWSTLWDTCSSSAVWQQLMANAEIISADITEHDGSTGTSRALVSMSESPNRVAWIAFPGATTGASFESGYRSGQVKVHNDETTRHHNYFQEFQKLYYEGSLRSWISDHSDEFEHVIVTGHSKGGVMSQFLLDVESSGHLRDKQIYLTAFGSPHSGNQTYIRDYVCDLPIVRGRFYLTYFDKNSKNNYDFIESKKESIDHDLVNLEGVDIKSDGVWATVHYPRGMSGALEPDAYLDAYCDSFRRVNLRADYSASAMYKVNSVYDRMVIHGTSYYLSALEDAESSFSGTDITTQPQVDYGYGARVWGGSGGNAFDDITVLRDGLLDGGELNIFKIGLRSGDRVDQISIEYDNGKVVSHGGSGGGAQVSNALLSTTTLQEVEVCKDYSDKYNSTTIHYIKFTLSSGYKMSGGTRRGECVTLKSNLGHPILGFRGSSGAELDSLGIIIEKPAVSDL